VELLIFPLLTSSAFQSLYSDGSRQKFSEEAMASAFLKYVIQTEGPHRFFAELLHFDFLVKTIQ
jgi:hypothetical protein